MLVLSFTLLAFPKGWSRMTRFRRWMAAWACLGMLIGPAMRSVADEPAGSRPHAAKGRTTAVKHLDLAFIPAQAVAAIVAHPAAVLTGPDSEWLPTEVITAAGMKEAGVGALQIRQEGGRFPRPHPRPPPPAGRLPPV